MTFSQNGNGRLTLKQQMLMKGILYDFSRHNARNAQHAQFAVSVKPEEGNQWTWVYPAKEVDYNGALDSYIE